MSYINVTKLAPAAEMLQVPLVALTFQPADLVRYSAGRVMCNV